MTYFRLISDRSLFTYVYNLMTIWQSNQDRLDKDDKDKQRKIQFDEPRNGRIIKQN